MTKYDEKFNLPVISPAESINEPLGKILADHNKLQIRIAETEKYAHITFFFNGYRKEPFPNEYRVLVPLLISPLRSGPGNDGQNRHRPSSQFYQ